MMIIGTNIYRNVMQICTYISLIVMAIIIVLSSSVGGRCKLVSGEKI